jgi:hypothetical protein
MKKLILSLVPLLVAGALCTVRPGAALAGARHINMNGRPVTAEALMTIAALEQRSNGYLPDGSYWYDARSGALGKMGGPTLVIIPAGLELGGPLPPYASGGGDGRLTGIFINGRELHPIDVQGLSAFIGSPIYPGRYWVDGMANAGLEGGPAMWNLVWLAQQRQRAQGGIIGGHGVQIAPDHCVQGTIHHLGGTNTNYMSPSC